MNIHLEQSSRITELFSIKHPLVQAPIAGAATPELVAAVSNYGGLGTIAAGFMSAQELSDEIDQVRKLTDKPFAVNLFADRSTPMTAEEVKQAIQRLSNYYEANDKEKSVIEIPHNEWQLEDLDDLVTVVLDKEVPIISFSLGVPEDNIIELLKSSGAKVIGTATHMIEALYWEEKGADAIFFQGVEAGGMRTTFIGNSIKFAQTTFALAAQGSKALSIPIILSGGICDQKSYLAALILGADAVGVGTAFLTTHESQLSEEYKDRIMNSNEFDSTLTKEWTGIWGRCLSNKGLKKMRNMQGNPACFPMQAFLIKAISEQVDPANELEFTPIWIGINGQFCQRISSDSLMAYILEGKISTFENAISGQEINVEKESIQEAKEEVAVFESFKGTIMA